MYRILARRDPVLPCVPGRGDIQIRTDPRKCNQDFLTETSPQTWPFLRLHISCSNLYLNVRFAGVSNRGNVITHAVRAPKRGRSCRRSDPSSHPSDYNRTGPSKRKRGLMIFTSFPLHNIGFLLAVTSPPYWTSPSGTLFPLSLVHHSCRTALLCTLHVWYGTLR